MFFFTFRSTNAMSRSASLVIPPTLPGLPFNLAQLEAIRSELAEVTGGGGADSGAGAGRSGGRPGAGAVDLSDDAVLEVREKETR